MQQVLIVDDDDSLRESFRRLLEMKNLKVLEASDGAQALALLQKEPVGLVITDIFMPYQDGITTIMEIREQYPDMKIIAISGGGRLATVDYLELAKDLGAHHVFQKPFDYDELFAVIEKLSGS